MFIPSWAMAAPMGTAAAIEESRPVYVEAGQYLLRRAAAPGRRGFC